jgi:hypothetical protein
MRQGPDAGTIAGRHEYVRSSCGRELTIGRLVLGDHQHPAARVFVDLGDCPSCGEARWAGLTVAEARRFAQAVLTQAAAAERDCRPPAAQTELT